MTRRYELLAIEFCSLPKSFCSFPSENTILPLLKLSYTSAKSSVT